MSRIRPLIGRGTVPFAAFAVGRPAGPLEPVLDLHTERLSRTIGEIGTLRWTGCSTPAWTPNPTTISRWRLRRTWWTRSSLRAGWRRRSPPRPTATCGPEGRSKLERGLALLRRR